MMIETYPLDFNSIIPLRDPFIAILFLKVREDRQLRVETVLKYSNYNVKADELLVCFASKHLHSSDPCFVMYLDVMMS